MIRYILKRLFTFLPMLLVISLVAFVISVSSPGDPVERLLSGEQDASGETKASNMDRQSQKQLLRHKLGLDLPVFFFSISALSDIDTLYRIEDPAQQEVVQRIARHSGQPALSVKWLNQVNHTESLLSQVPIDSAMLSDHNYSENLAQSRSMLHSISRSNDPSSYSNRCDSLSLLLSIIPGLTEVRSSWEKSIHLRKEIDANESSWKQWIPVVHWHGIKNQYYRWILGDNEERKGVLRGDFGLSFRDGQAISDRILSRMKWSLGIALLSMLIAFLVSIPIGIIAGSNTNAWFDKISGTIVFGLYSLPGFFVATGLLVLFANPDVFDWFPSSGVKDINTFNPEWPFYQRVQHYMPYLVLPVLSYSYASFAFISRQVRSSIHHELQLDYIRTARAKGLSEKRVLIAHAFRNSLLPLITILGQSLPLVFGGSVIIESIYSIPGMGQEIYESVLNYDYPMIVAIFTIFGFLTMLGYLLSDILYAITDPRIRLKSSRS
ncbi:MAG: hypothetical protein RLZZ543_1352 [Bacteroidota bacterium]